MRNNRPYLRAGEEGTIDSLIELMTRNAIHMPMSMHLLGNIVYEFAIGELAIVESYSVAYQTHRDDRGVEDFREPASGTWTGLRDATESGR